MCHCKINCLCSLKKINENMQLEIEVALLLNDLLTCENLDVVKDKLKNILDNLKKESNQIVNILQLDNPFFEERDIF